ncbi:MAG: LptF/LptG family permease, partial [Paracoccaceae bacterium]|nr:LptF/LptG family permease [Paracoccaceae bacterium]
IAFSNDGLPRLRQDAKQARLSDGTWIMQDVKQWDFENNRNPEQAALLFDELTIPSDLTADEIRDGFGVPSTVPIWELPAFIDRLERAGFSALRHRVWLSMELSLPVMLAAMVMMGAVFTMRHTRLGRTGVMVLLSLLLGFSIYFLRNFAQILGESGQIPVNLAAWAPPVAAILLSLGMLLHLEDG